MIINSEKIFVFSLSVLSFVLSSSLACPPGVNLQQGLLECHGVPAGRGTQNCVL